MADPTNIPWQQQQQQAQQQQQQQSIMQPQSSSSQLTPPNQKQQIEASLRHSLETSGELERIHSLMHARLIESGWRDAMKDRAKEVIRKRGLEPVTMDELVKELIPMGRATVPPEVKKMVVEHVRGFAMGNESGSALSGGGGGGGAVS